MWAGVRIGALGAALAVTAACGSSSPTAPGTTVPPSIPPPSGHIVTGTTVNALTGGPAASISIVIGGTSLGASAADGTFRVGFSASGNNRITLSGAGFVTRETGIQAPALDLRLSLIPANFELNAFNQMFRHTSSGILARWMTPPHLLIERRVLQFTDVGAWSYAALTDTLTDADVASLTADLTDGYAILTDGRLGTFASVTQQTTATGGSVAVSNDGRIVVTRVEGLTEKTNFWSYARWSTTADGAVTRAFVMIDAGFERSTSPAHVPYKRSLRLHELGHALGCQHVSDITSVMNANARSEPTTFDRNAARLAMIRPVGNRAPDVDPAGPTALSLSRTTTASIWHGAH